jgi:hypothetical protein
MLVQQAEREGFVCPSVLSVHMCLCLFVYMPFSLYVSLFYVFCLSTLSVTAISCCHSIFLFLLYLSLCLSSFICPSVCLSLCPSFLFVHHVCSSVNLSVCPTDHNVILFVCSSVCLPVHMSICLSVCLYVSLYVCVYISLYVCLSAFVSVRNA